MIALHRSGAVRLAALFLVLLISAVVAAFATTYWIVRAETLARMRADLVARADRIASRLQTEPPETALADPARQRVAALFNPDGSLVAGSAGLSAFTGWRTISAADVHLEEPGEETSDQVLAYGRRIGDRTLVVGQGMRDLEDTGETLLDGLLGSLAIVVLVGFAGAALIAWRVDRRLGRTEEALNAYASGDMSRRLPVVGSGDELDRMALAVNAVLDRLAAVIEATRQVTADAAHDLKTPMTRLRHRLAEAEGASAAELKAVLGAAARDAEQIVATFDALLRIAQIEAGARRARFDLVDLSDVLETVADAYGPDAEKAGQRLDTKVSPDLHVRGDRDLLTQTFANLVENAIRHAGMGATITVRAATRDSLVEAEISDTGPGIPEADRERVLRRFVRLETSRSTPGTGLGLTLVKAIADLHDARIELADNHPGLQVTVTFTEADVSNQSDQKGLPLGRRRPSDYGDDVHLP
jgi:signal transduction histidine kinase